MASKVDLKVVLLGSAMSGKTSLVERYIYERFTGTNQSVRACGTAHRARRPLSDASSHLPWPGAEARGAAGIAGAGGASALADGRSSVWGQDPAN